MPRLGAVGTLVWDTVRPADPEAGAREGWGGIAYALEAFEACGPPGWSLLPIVKVGGDLRDPADALLLGLERLASLEGVRTVPEPTNRVELIYRDGEHRTEVLSGGVPGWEWEELRPLARSCDALYLNLIAGWELDLPCAEELSGAADVPIYCDLHSLLLDVAPDGTRVPRVPEGWEVWVELFDYLQMNEQELGLLAEEAGEAPEGLAGRIVAGRPSAVFVTRGEEGAEWFAAPGRGGSESGGSPDGGTARRGSDRVEAPVEGGDPTGCGDVWGMACFSALLGGADVPEAVGRANRLARRAALHRGAEGLARALSEEVSAAGPGPAG